MVTDHTYRVIEVVGSSPESAEAAIQPAVTKASKTLRNIRWVDVRKIRGQIRDGKVAYHQVTLKMGFTLEEESDS
jgi:flavin-binding protein dodecin